MVAQHPACHVHDLSGVCRSGPQLFDHGGVISIGNKADILTVRLVGHRQAVARRKCPGFRLAGQPAQRKAQVRQLLCRGREQEIALVAVCIRSPVQLRPARPDLALDIVTCRHAIGIEIPRRGQQVPELHPLVAADAGHGRGPGKIGIRKLVDDRRAEHVFVIQHVMGKAHRLGDPAGVVNVAARAAGPRPCQRRPVIVKLQRDADHVIAFFGQVCGHHGTVHAARHCDHNPRRLRGLGKTKGIEWLVKRHGASPAKGRQMAARPRGI